MGVGRPVISRKKAEMDYAEISERFWKQREKLALKLKFTEVVASNRTPAPLYRRDLARPTQRCFLPLPRDLARPTQRCFLPLPRDHFPRTSFAVDAICHAGPRGGWHYPTILVAFLKTPHLPIKSSPSLCHTQPGKAPPENACSSPRPAEGKYVPVPPLSLKGFTERDVSRQ